MPSGVAKGRGWRIWARIERRLWQKPRNFRFIFLPHSNRRMGWIESETKLRSSGLLEAMPLAQPILRVDLLAFAGEV
jgi:hypothetical protein